MIVTAKILRELGAKNVIALSMPVALINGLGFIAKILKYNSLEEIKLANWFNDLKNVGIIIICESEGVSDQSGEYIVGLFDLSQGKGDDPWNEDKFSPLSLYRAKISLLKEIDAKSAI